MNVQGVAGPGVRSDGRRGELVDRVRPGDHAFLVVGEASAGRAVRCYVLDVTSCPGKGEVLDVMWLDVQHQPHRQLIPADCFSKVVRLAELTR